MRHGCLSGTVRQRRGSANLYLWPHSLLVRAQAAASLLGQDRVLLPQSFAAVARRVPVSQLQLNKAARKTRVGM